MCISREGTAPKIRQPRNWERFPVLGESRQHFVAVAKLKTEKVQWSGISFTTAIDPMRLCITNLATFQTLPRRSGNLLCISFKKGTAEEYNREMPFILSVKNTTLNQNIINYMANINNATSYPEIIKEAKL
jgi:hypothetical protein